MLDKIKGTCYNADRWKGTLNKENETMVTQAHTAGKWEYDKSLKYYQKPVIRMNGQIIAIMSNSQTLLTLERDANARLIAKAPEMFELVQMIMAQSQDGMDRERAILTRATSILAAIKGE